MSFNIVDYFVFFIIFLVILKFLKLIKYVVESSSTRKHLPLREFWNGSIKYEGFKLQAKLMWHYGF